MHSDQFNWTFSDSWTSRYIAKNYICLFVEAMILLTFLYFYLQEYLNVV